MSMLPPLPGRSVSVLLQRIVGTDVSSYKAQ